MPFSNWKLSYKLGFDAKNMYLRISFGIFVFAHVIITYTVSGFISRVPNFRFIRDSHRSVKKRIHVNFHPLLHKYFYFLK